MVRVRLFTVVGQCEIWLLLFTPQIRLYLNARVCVCVCTCLYDEFVMPYPVRHVRFDLVMCYI